MKKFLPILFIGLVVSLWYGSSDPPPDQSKEKIELQESVLKYQSSEVIIIDDKPYEVVWTEDASAPKLIPLMDRVNLKAINKRNAKRARDGLIQQVKYFQSPEEIPPLESIADAENEDVGWFDWIKNNWSALIAGLLSLMGVIEIIVQLTPTEKENAWFSWLRNIVSSLLPNNKKGGGTHPVA